MLNSINEVQRQYTTAIQPVQLFEVGQNHYTKKSSPNPFDKDKMNFNTYNLLHPNVTNSTSGSKLDLLG